MTDSVGGVGVITRSRARIRSWSRQSTRRSSSDGFPPAGPRGSLRDSQGQDVSEIAIRNAETIRRTMGKRSFVQRREIQGAGDGKLAFFAIPIMVSAGTPAGHAFGAPPAARTPVRGKARRPGTEEEGSRAGVRASAGAGPGV